MHRCGITLALLLAVSAVGAVGCGEEDYSERELAAASGTAALTNTVGRFLLGFGEPIFDFDAAAGVVEQDYLAKLRTVAANLRRGGCAVVQKEEAKSVALTLVGCSWLFGTIVIDGTYKAAIETFDFGTAAAKVVVAITLSDFRVNALHVDGSFEVTRSRDELLSTLELNTRSMPMLTLVAQGSLKWAKSGARTCMTINAFGAIGSDAGKIVGSFTNVRVCDGAARGPCPDEGAIAVVGRSRHAVTFAAGRATYTRDDGPQRDLPTCR